MVQKFGGTSVGKFALNIIDQVVLYAYNPFLLSSFLNYHGQSANRMLSNLDQAFQNTTWPWSALQEAVLLKPRALLTGESYPYMSAQCTITIVRKKTLY